MKSNADQRCKWCIKANRSLWICYRRGHISLPIDIVQNMVEKEYNEQYPEEDFMSKSLTDLSTNKEA